MRLHLDPCSLRALACASRGALAVAAAHARRTCLHAVQQQQQDSAAAAPWTWPSERLLSLLLQPADSPLAACDQAGDSQPFQHAAALCSLTLRLLGSPLSPIDPAQDFGGAWFLGDVPPRQQATPLHLPLSSPAFTSAFLGRRTNVEALTGLELCRVRLGAACLRHGLPALPRLQSLTLAHCEFVVVAAPAASGSGWGDGWGPRGSTMVAASACLDGPRDQAEEEEEERVDEAWGRWLRGLNALLPERRRARDVAKRGEDDVPAQQQQQQQGQAGEPEACRWAWMRPMQAGAWPPLRALRVLRLAHLEDGAAAAQERQRGGGESGGRGGLPPGRRRRGLRVLLCLAAGGGALRRLEVGAGVDDLSALALLRVAASRGSALGALEGRLGACSVDGGGGGGEGGVGRPDGGGGLTHVVLSHANEVRG